MQCSEVELVLEEQGLVPLPKDARAHLAGCVSCRNLVSDLTEIVATAHLLPAEVEPPARVWSALRAQLEAEGVIRDAAAPQRSWWHGFSDLFSTRVLATATVGLLLIAAAYQQFRYGSNDSTSRTVQSASQPFAETALALAQQERGLANVHLASAASVDASLRQNLQIVDDFIADCERHAKDDPQDDLTREYLSGAYQQKAELLSAMMERGGSVN